MRGGEREVSTEGVEVEGNIPKQTGCHLPCFTPLGPCEVLKSDGPLASVSWALPIAALWLGALCILTEL